MPTPHKIKVKGGELKKPTKSILNPHPLKRQRQIQLPLSWIGRNVWSILKYVSLGLIVTIVALVFDYRNSNRPQIDVTYIKQLKSDEPIILRFSIENKQSYQIKNVLVDSCVIAYKPLRVFPDPKGSALVFNSDSITFNFQNDYPRNIPPYQKTTYITKALTAILGNFRTRKVEMKGIVTLSISYDIPNFIFLFERHRSEMFLFCLTTGNENEVICYPVSDKKEPC